MKKIIYLLLLFPVLATAQIKLAGKVLDANTKQPIAYVNIENFRVQVGTQTNQNGIFELNLLNGKQTDTIKISCVGYADKYVTNLQSNEQLVYELLPVVFQLSEVKVSNQNPTEVEVGIVKKTGRDVVFFNKLIQRPGTQQAVYMENVESKVAYIKTVFFYLGDEMFDAPFRVRVYESENGLPGKDLLNKSVEFAAKKKNAWNELDISTYSLLVPENGFFVSVEWIANDKYRKTDFQNKVSSGGTLEKVAFNYYGPKILHRFDTGYGLTYYRTLAGKWYKAKGGVGNGKIKREVKVDLLVKARLEVYP
jgi:5-hydroxyisourate hydrolase-like protein (transthyretin family)